MNIDNIPEGFEVVEEEKVDLVPEGFEIVEEEEDKKKKQAEAQVDANAEAVVGDSKPVSFGSASPIVENNTATTEVTEVQELEETVDEEVEEPKKTTKQIKEEFKAKFGVNFKNIDKAIQADADKVEANFQEKLNTAFFSEGGITKLLRTADDGTEYYDMDRLQQDMYNKIVEEYKVELDAVNKKYEDVNKRIDAYNVLAEDENKKALDEFNKSQLEQKQHRIESLNDLFFNYDKDGNLTAIYDRAHIEDNWVTRDDMTFEEFSILPANENLSKRDLKKKWAKSIFSKPKFDSVEDYVDAWNQTKRNGYITQQQLLPELVVDFETDKTYEKQKNRVNYFNSNIDSQLFKNFAEGQVVPAMEEILPEGFVVEEAVSGADYITVIHEATGDEVTIGVDYNDDDSKDVVRQKGMLVDFLANHSDANTINKIEKNLASIHKYVEEAEARPSNDPNSPGLNVEWMRPGFIKEYASEYDDKTGDYTLNMFNFANVKTPSYKKRDTGPISISSSMAKKDAVDKDMSRIRGAQQTAFNLFMQGQGEFSGEVEYSTMPTYVRDLEYFDIFGNKTERGVTKYPSAELANSYTLEKGKGSNNKNLTSIEGYEAALEYSIENNEAMFFYTDKEGKSFIFDTKKWSEENDGKNFTEFINKKAVDEILVEEELTEEKKRAYENYVEIDRWESEERKVQGKFILSALNINKKTTKALYANKHEQRVLESKLKNASTTYTDIVQNILNVPGYDIELRPGDDLVEIQTNYGEKVVIPKRFADQQKKEKANFTFLSESYNKNQLSQESILSEIDDVNDQWEVYKLNYSDLESNTQNFAFSVANVVTDLAYGGYKYLTPAGWVMTALKSTGVIDSDPITQTMMSWKSWQDDKNSIYRGATQFGEMRNASDFGSWFFQMIGTQLPQFGVMLFSGGSATIPMVAMGTMSAGSADLDFRKQVLTGERDYNEFGVLWRSVLSGSSEALFATLPTWKILNKGKSLINGVGGNATSQAAKSGYDFLRKQVPSIITDVSVDSGFEVVNGIAQNYIAGRPATEGLGEIAVTSILSSGPVAVVSPVYYAMTTKDFIGADLRENISELSYKESKLIEENKRLELEVKNLIDNNLTQPDFGGVTVIDKVQNINKKIADNSKALQSLQVDINSNFSELDNRFKNKGLNPDGTGDFNAILYKMSILKGQARDIQNSKTLTPEQKTKELDAINTVYLKLDQSKNFYTSKKYFGNAFFSLKGSAVFNPKKKAIYKKLMTEAETALLEVSDNPSAEQIQDKAIDIYSGQLVEKQLAKDLIANPNLIIARSLDEAKSFIEKQNIKESAKKEQIKSLEAGSKNGLYVEGGNFLAYKPNMVTNMKFNTGAHETSHSPSMKFLNKDPEKFKAFGDQLVKYMEESDPQMWRAIQAGNFNIRVKDKDNRPTNEWDYEEVVASFVEAVGSGKIKLDKKGNMPAMLGFLFNKGLDQASNGEFTIPFNGQDDVVSWFKGLAKALNDGNITIGKYEKLLSEAIGIDLETDNIIDLNADESINQRIAASKSSESRQIGQQINDVIGDANTASEIQTELYANFLSEDAPSSTSRLIDNAIKSQLEANGVNTKMDKDGNAPNVYGKPLNDVLQDVKDKLVSNTLMRLDMDKVVMRDGKPDVGGFIISELARYRIGDVTNKLKKEKGNVSIDNVTSDGQTFDTVDTDADSKIIEGAENRKADVTPRSKLKKAAPEFVTPELESEVETAVLEILEGVTPDADSKDFKPFIKEVLEGKLTGPVKKALGLGKNYDFLIKKLGPKLKDILPVDYFVKIESQTKPEDRIFTKPPVRLTKQADIDAAMLDDKVYVENTKQGVNLYEFKDFDSKKLIDYILAPATSPTTGKKSGLKGNRKTTTATTIASELGKDMLPSIMKGLGMSDKQISTASRKIQRDPRIKMSEQQKHQDMRNLTGQVDIFDGTNPVEAAKSVKAVSDFATGPLTTQLKGDVFAVISPSTLNPIGNRWSKQMGQGLFLTDVFPRSKKNLNLYNETVAINEALVAEGVLGTLKDLQKDVENALGMTKKEGQTIISKVISNQGLEQLEGNLENLAKHQKAVQDITRAFKRAYDSDPSSLPVIKEFLYNPNASKMWGKNAALVRSTMDGILKGDKRYEEHTYQFSNWALRTIQAITSKNPKVYEGWLKWSNDNYYQTVFDLSTKMMGSPYQTQVLNKGTVFKSVDPTMMTYQEIVDKKYIKDGIVWEAQAGEHPLLKDRFDKFIKTGDAADYSRIPPSEIRFFNEYFSLNPFKLSLDGQSFAAKYGMKVDAKLEDNPSVAKFAGNLIYEQILTKAGVLTGDKAMTPAKAQKLLDEAIPVLIAETKVKNSDNVPMLKKSKVLNLKNSDQMTAEDVLSKAMTIDQALRNARNPKAPIKKIRVFDFDDTLATSKNIVIATKDGATKQLNAEEFAKNGKSLTDDGWIMDFSDFNNVTEGGKGPLFDIAKKIKEARGNEDLFVLTARAPEARDAIYEFLKAEGLEFKRENIVGLGNSTGEAKSNWIIDRAAEGYNDFYFADDAYQNYKAVRDALEVIDVKSKVQQAKIKSSENMSMDFNIILEESTGMDRFATYSDVKAKVAGARKGKGKFFIPPSAEDFTGLLYATLGKGKQGTEHMRFYDKHLLKPYAQAMENLTADRITLMNDFKALKKELEVPKDLRKQTKSGFTNEQAVRVYLWDQTGQSIPGISKRDFNELTSIVENDPKLKVFADQILKLTKGDGYSTPKTEWAAGTITTDLIDLLNTTKRSKYLETWQENVNIIFSKENMNKLEAILGPKYVQALRSSLARMKAGKNRVDGGNRLSNQVLDYINQSTGVTMFFNARSALLQTISSANFINWSFNSPYHAGKAFANQKQYWSDFTMLMNSDYLKDRRNGLKLNINENEIADAAKTSTNKAKAALNYIIEKGYIPTKFADSFAIASGGALFYRNRVNDLIKNEGKTKAEAEAQAMIEFKQKSEESQQSSDPSKISEQQSGDLGRIILQYVNTPMQYARIQKRDIQDIINRRPMPGKTLAQSNRTRLARIAYYSFLQNMAFNALQQGLFALGFGDDEDDLNEEQLAALDKDKNKRYFNTINGMLDSQLRGLGFAGVTVQVLKNLGIDIYNRSKRDRPEYSDAWTKLLEFSPAIKSKLSKFRGAGYNFDTKARRQEVFDKGFSLDNPAYESVAKVISATTNIPLDRIISKVNNLKDAMAEDTEAWQSVAMVLGWPKWQLDIDIPDAPLTEEQKEKAKASKAVEAYKAAKGSTDYDTIKKLTSAQQIKMLKGLGYGDYTIKNAKSEQAKIDLIIHKNKGGKIKVDKKAVDTAKYKALSKADQVRKLDSLGLSKADIAALKYEKDRVAKLLELMK